MSNRYIFMQYVYVSRTNVTDNLLEIWNCQDHKNGDNI